MPVTPAPALPRDCTFAKADWLALHTGTVSQGSWRAVPVANFNW
jgi:hypothetical protein